MKNKTNSDKWKIALIYHSSDNDGLMSAFLLSKWFESFLDNKHDRFEAVLIGYNYEEDADWMKDPTIRQYIFADVTPPLEWLKFQHNWNELEKNSLYFEFFRDTTQLDLCLFPHDLITIIDHHKDKLEQIKELDYSYINIYDFSAELKTNNESGCYGVYKCYSTLLHKNFGYKALLSIEKYFWLVKAISDYDTWKFPLYPEMEAERILKIDLVLGVCLKVPEKYFEAVEELCSITTNNYGVALGVGTMLLHEERGKAIKTVSDGSLISENIFIFEGYPNYYIEKEIKSLYPEVKIWIGFEKKEDKGLLKYAVRSSNEKALEIAKMYDGGGHLNAAGFTINLDTEDYFEKTLVESPFTVGLLVKLDIYG